MRSGLSAHSSCVSLSLNSAIFIADFAYIEFGSSVCGLWMSKPPAENVIARSNRLVSNIFKNADFFLSNSGLKSRSANSSRVIGSHTLRLREYWPRINSKLSVNGTKCSTALFSKRINGGSCNLLPAMTCRAKLRVNSRPSGEVSKNEPKTNMCSFASSGEPIWWKKKENNS